jgi:hypothetical protein
VDFGIIFCELLLIQFVLLSEPDLHGSPDAKPGKGAGVKHFALTLTAVAHKVVATYNGSTNLANSTPASVSQFVQ